MSSACSFGKVWEGPVRCNIFSSLGFETGLGKMLPIHYFHDSLLLGAIIQVSLFAVTEIFLPSVSKPEHEKCCRIACIFFHRFQKRQIFFPGFQKRRFFFSRFQKRQIFFSRFWKRPVFFPRFQKRGAFLVSFPETARFLLSFPETGRFSFVVSRNGRLSSVVPRDGPRFDSRVHPT